MVPSSVNHTSSLHNSQQQLITASEQKYISCTHYSKIDFWALWRGNRHDTDSTISRDGLTFMDYVGKLYLTGTDLLYYPALTQHLRTVKEYPTLTRVYPVDGKIQGMAFIEYFFDYALKSFEAFRAELREASSQVDNLIHLYGRDRQIPLIDSIEADDRYPNKCYTKVIINGVTWHIGDAYSSWKITEYINLYKFFSISIDYTCVELEDALPGTPFLALRLRKTYKHKGHVIWYNLNTREPASKTDIAKAKSNAK